MKQNFYKSMLCALTLTATIGSVPVFAAETNVISPMKAHFLRSQGSRFFDANSIELPNTRGAVEAPAGSFDLLPRYSEISTPEGNLFITASYEYEYIEWNQYYTEERIKAFEFTVYDPDFNVIGTIRDDIYLDTESGETKAQLVMPGAIATKHFFNDDDNWEISIFFAMNTDAPYYRVHSYEKIYSLNGEKDENGNDVSLCKISGSAVDIMRLSDDDSDAIITFHEDQFFTNEDYPDPVDRAQHSVSHLYFYRKGANGAEMFHQKDILLCKVPGDTTGALYMMTKKVNGVPYYIFSEYELPYFVNPLGGAMDESATPDNNLVIENFKFENGEFIKLNTTKIPVIIPIDANNLHYTFLSIGDLTGSDDIDMTVNGTPESPAYIVKQAECLASSVEDVTARYDIYKADGTVVRTLSQATESFKLMNRVGNAEPQIMFVVNDPSRGYLFEFVELYSGRTTLSVPVIFEGEQLTATCERIRTPDGDIIYGFSGYLDSLDDDGNVLKRIIWLNEDGTLHHYDNVNIGKNVEYCQVNLNSESLDPFFYDSDPEMEYAMLVKRQVGEGLRNEFIITDDKGEWYANFSADDGRGDPWLFTALKTINGGKVYMIYDNNFKYNIDVYNVPFETLGVGEVINEKIDSTITYDGEVINATNAYVEVYNTAGICVAAAHGSVPVTDLANGIYIVKVKDANGKTVSLKIAK